MQGIKGGNTLITLTLEYRNDTGGGKLTLMVELGTEHGIPETQL